MKYRLSCGSTLGYDHQFSKINCQDSLRAVDTEDFSVGFVVDGIGDPIDSPFSEVGSRIVAKIATQYVEERLNKTLSWRRKKMVLSNEFWLDVQNYILDRIEKIATLMGGSYRSTIIQYFLFTITGFVSVADVIVFVGVGDGFVVVNDYAYRLEKPSVGNMPASMTYNLVESNLRKMSPEEITLSIKFVANKSEVDTFAVATDGLRFMVAEVPGEDYFVVKEIYCFWNNASYFENPFTFGWALGELASQKKTVDWKEQEVKITKPVVKDDLAVVMGSKE